MIDIYINKNPASEAFEKLICEMLRGPHVTQMKESEVKNYIYKVGVAIHNIPHYIFHKKHLDENMVKIINSLDPSSKNGKTWGNWVKIIQPSLIGNLPSTPIK